MGNMTVEEIYRDRKTFSQNVFESASADLYNMGVSVVSYTLRDVSDDVGYLASLGQARQEILTSMLCPEMHGAYT